MDMDTLYYCNIGKGSTITREMIGNLFKALAEELMSETFRKFVSKSRVPNERELYGIFVKALVNSCKDDLGHIATEFQVERCAEVNCEDSKGRVDLLFDYRSVSYLVELKVGRVNARGEDKEPKIRAIKAWHKAVQQLYELNADSVDALLRKKTVKLPIALYFFDSTKEINDEEIKHRELHENILDSIRINDDGSDTSPDFCWYSPLERISTRLRKSNCNDEEDNYIYGFSIFAGMPSDSDD